jgi:hypothetical protein
MKLYQSHKRVRAAKIVAVTPDPGRSGLGLELDDGDRYFAPAGMISRYTPLPGDYLIEYEDGYRSISPAKAFEGGYTMLD